MSYTFTCFSDGCTDLSYTGTLRIVAAYQSAERPQQAGYRIGLSRRTGVEVRGAAFDILTADLERDAVTADRFADPRDDATYVRTEGIAKRDLKTVFTTLMRRSPKGILFAIFQYNGMASRDSGPPVPHENLAFVDFLDRIDKDQVVEDMLYVVRDDHGPR
jgi:hypothetical protein